MLTINEEILRLSEVQKQELRSIKGIIDDKDFDAICLLYLEYFLYHTINEREFSKKIEIFTKKVKNLIETIKLKSFTI